MNLRHVAMSGGVVFGLLGACTPPAVKAPNADALTRALPVLPRPRSERRCEGALVIDRSSTITGPGQTGRTLARWLGLPRDAVSGSGTGTIELRLGPPSAAGRDPAESPPANLEEDAFTLEIDATKAIVSARSSAGLFYGSQALAQLAGARRIGSATRPLGPAKTWSLPCITIDDAPRWTFRGMHLDVARHFFDRDAVLRYVDLLAFYRINVFHWHLTDDQGFRLDVGGLASPDGWYTKADVEAVVAAARERFITVIPEIEMPGHVRSVLAVRPELSCTGKRQDIPRSWGIFDDVLCAGNPATYELVRDVLGEVTKMFPSRLVHVGGDEVPPARWNACPKCRAAMKDANVDAIGLEHVFMERVFGLLAALGRRPLVWDEALPPAPGANPPIVVAWQSPQRGREAAARGFDTVLAPYEQNYFNFKQSAVHGVEPGHEGHLPWTKVHAIDPSQAGGSHVLGAEGALWTEYVQRPEHIDTLVMPRLAALGEALWSGPGDDAGFVARFDAQLRVLDASNVRYFVDPPFGLRARSVFVDRAVATMTAPPLFPRAVLRFTTDGSMPGPSSPIYAAPIEIAQPTTITAATFLPSGRTSAPFRAVFAQETPRPAAPPSATGVTCSYYEGAFHKLDHVLTATPAARGVLRAIDLDEAKAHFGRLGPDHFGLDCEGHIQIALTGVHRFAVRADDGVRLDIDGETVVDIDGETGPREADGEIALAAGAHRIHVLYFQGTEGKELGLQVDGARLDYGGR